MQSLFQSPPTKPPSLALFRVINRYVGNLAPMPGVFPDYPAPVVRNTGSDSRTDDDALGHAAAAEA